jgi:hypothetical protein
LENASAKIVFPGWMMATSLVVNKTAIGMSRLALHLPLEGCSPTLSHLKP